MADSEEEPIPDYQALVLALERERLATPTPAPVQRPPPHVPPSRRRWQANNPTITFRVSLEMWVYLHECRDKADLGFRDIMMIGVERLAHLDLVNALKTRISQEEKL